MAAPIRVNVRGIEELREFFRQLPRGTIRTGILAATIYLIGDEYHGLKYYPARVQHGKDNPYQWQSEKQRRAYFATNGFGGGIPSKRTYELREGWGYKPTNYGYRMEIYNSSDHSQYVNGDQQQRGHAADKWRRTAAIITTNIAGAMRAAEQAVVKWIKEHSKG
jgi:hypothetical protein